MAPRPVLVLHGGACSKALRATHFAEVTDSLRRILQSCYPALNADASAVEVVTRAVSMLEDDPLYNAGFGSRIQRDGKIRMSASIMDGSKRRFAGCVNVEGVKNPTRLARALMRTKDRVLSGEGAKRFGCSSDTETLNAPFV
jgi:L-asparaginase